MRVSIQELKILSSLTVIVFVLLAIPLTIYLSLNSDQNLNRVKASTPLAGYHEQAVATGLAQPVAMAFAADGRIFVTEQCRGVQVVKGSTKTTFVDLSSKVNCQGERGVLGLALDPAFVTNNYVYVYYTSSTGPHNRVSRFTASGDVAIANSEKILMDLDTLCSATNHNGGSLGFGTDGKLYIAQGDNFCDHTNAQRVNNWLGKVLRINSDGTAPTDNPFYNTAGAKKEIWAIGFRNPFTFAVNSTNGKIYVNDVGENSIEEVDDLQKGANYGSPDCEGNQNWLGTCTGHGYIAPIFTYDHNTGHAITGGTFYNGTTFPGKTGHYFFGDYVYGWIKDYDPATGAVASASFTTSAAGPVNIQMGSDGKLYYVAHDGGGIYAISYGTDPLKPGAIALWCETEGATLSAPMVIGADTTASGGSFISSNVNDTTTVPPTTTGSAVLNVNIPKAGTYALWSRVKYADTASNSFYLQVNQTSTYYRVGNEDNAGAWHWINFANGDTSPSIITYNFTAPGAYQIKLLGREANTKIDRLFFTDDLNYTPDDTNFPGTAACSTNKPPVPTIASPLSTLKYNYNQSISFSGSATDPEDGTLAGTSLNWQIFMGHNDGAPHTHNAYTFDKVVGSSFLANNLGGGEPSANTWYVVQLTATDSKGSSATTSVNIYPNTATMTFNSVPAGLTLSLDNVKIQAAPFTYKSIVGFPFSITAPTPQTLGTKKYNFVSWSDGKAASHAIANSASDTTYTATYQEEVDNQAPSANITSPTAGQSVSGVVNITANATDNVGVVNVDFFNDKALSALCSDTIAPYSCAWDTTKVPNGPYNLFVIARDAANNAFTTGQTSVTVANGDTTAPSVPTGLAFGSVVYNQVDLSWAASSDNVGVTKYYIVRNNSTIGTSATTSYQDKTVLPSTNYSYQVIAEDAALNRSAASASVSTKTPAAPDTTVPTTPGSLTANPASSSQINLAWIASTDNIGVAGYEIWREVTGGTFSKIATVGPTTSFGDTGLTDATTYTYYVVAFDAAGNKSPSSNSAIAKTAAITGFIGHWFNTTAFGNEVLPTTNDQAINFNWSGSPRTGVNPDGFSVRWTGKFTFDTALYRFNATSDDGVRIYIDAETTPIIDAWKDQSATSYNVLRAMSAGEHTVRVDYYDNCCGATVSANWVHANTCFDMTGDGVITQEDVNVVSKHFGQTETAAAQIPWDLSTPNRVGGDGTVSSIDLLVVAQKVGTSCQ